MEPFELLGRPRHYNLNLINSSVTLADEFPLFRPRGEMNVYTPSGVKRNDMRRDC